MGFRHTTLTGIIAATALATAACGSGDRQNQAAVDSAGRNLQLAPVDTSAVLNDRDGSSGTANSASTRTGSAGRATTGNGAAASSGGGGSLAAGTAFTARTSTRISSRTNKAGEIVSATVGTSVRDASGRVVIPAGSTVRMRIIRIHESENKSDATGTLQLALESVRIGGETYPLAGSVSVHGTLVGRNTNA
ncbi:MAG: hypothetical protein H0U85_10110, partial [Gemmatimonadales bacterium]|nr:hypothetical protein [Gemmatimonadales bacterium]